VKLAPSGSRTFQQVRACGLTVGGFVAPRELDRGHAAGLRASVSDRRVSTYDWRTVDDAQARKNVASLVAETGQHPAAYGNYLIDEPNAALFPGLAKVTALVHDLAPTLQARRASDHPRLPSP
jgi:hypothetical protein